jgi:phasin family protein
MIKGYEEIASFGKANVEALVQSSTLALKGAEELTKVFAALGNQNVERASAAVKALAGVRSPADLIQLQSQLTREGTDSLVSDSRKIAEIVNTIVTSALEPLQARFKAASDLYKVAA